MLCINAVKNYTCHNKIFDLIKPYMLNVDKIVCNKSKSYSIPLFQTLTPKSKAPPTQEIPSIIISTDDSVILTNPFIPIFCKKLVKAEKVQKANTPFFYPRQKDSLFWCYYIIKDGFAAYEYPGTTSFAREKELKFEYIELLRKCKQALKIKKIKNLQEDIENELANKDRIGMKTFIALCVASNINVFFIHKKKCFQLILDSDEPIYVIHQEDNPTRYSYETDVTKESIDNYKTTYFPWESVDKPLKSPSAYKVDEIRDLCIKIGAKIPIENGKKKTKKELYDLLLLAI